MQFSLKHTHQQNVREKGAGLVRKLNHSSITSNRDEYFELLEFRMEKIQGTVKIHFDEKILLAELRLVIFKYDNLNH